MPEERRSSTLEKALAVLEAILKHPQSVGLPDLTARLGLPRQTVHRILMQLEGQKLVVRDPSRERYSVGPRLSNLAFDALRSLNQDAPIGKILTDLVDDIGETCNTGVLDLLNYVYLQRVECQLPLRLRLEVGSRMPAHCVSGGKVLLASLDRQLCERLLRSRKLERPTSHSLGVSDLEAQFPRIRSHGYALNNEEFMAGIVGAAVPVIAPGGHVVAAVGMHAPVSRLSLKACEKHVPRLKRAADRVARVWFPDA